VNCRSITLSQRLGAQRQLCASVAKQFGEPRTGLQKIADAGLLHT